MKATMYPVKISPQGQITLPKALRQELGAVKGQLIYVSLSADGSLQLQAMPPIAQYRGILAPKPGQPSAVDAIHTVRQEQKAKLTRS